MHWTLRRSTYLLLLLSPLHISLCRGPFSSRARSVPFVCRRRHRCGCSALLCSFCSFCFWSPGLVWCGLLGRMLAGWLAGVLPKPLTWHIPSLLIFLSPSVLPLSTLSLLCLSPCHRSQTSPRRRLLLSISTPTLPSNSPYISHPSPPDIRRSLSTSSRRLWT